ncbi:MAG: AraC family transcriptional regulator [Bacteroidota bacterium]
MTITPLRLLELDFVQVFHQSKQLVLLQKSLDKTVKGKQSFLSMHALTYVVQGQQIIEAYEGEILSVQAGEIALIKKGLYTITDLLAEKDDFKACLLFFSDEILREVLKLHDTKTTAIQSSFFKLKAPDYLAHFWKSVEQVHSSLLNTSPTFFDIKAWEVFSALISHDESGKTEAKLRGLLQAKERSLHKFMEENFDKALSIDDFAYLTGRSPASFRREFKLKFGSSPRKWIIRQRLEKAAQLLQKSKMSVAEVAQEVGYESTSHFIQGFKKQFGQTPRQLLNLS